MTNSDSERGRGITQGNLRSRWLRPGIVVAAVVAVAISPLATSAIAAKSRVPAPSVALPATVDWQAEYQGQTLCSDWAKPGAVKLAALLNNTYGKYTTYIPRSCATAGVSEHEEGRAIDWMVNAEKADENAKAWDFLNWVTAAGPNGEPGAMARRLGIMYVIWDDKMWRVYRPQDGWQPYSGCAAKQDDGYDTSCHRDHIHISLTWDGAYAATSFWTAKAETRMPCASSATSRPNGSPGDPSTLINTDTGKGLSGGGCRLSAGTSYGSKSYTVKVPVPTTTNGEAPVQRVQLKQFDLAGPEPLVIKSAKTITVPQGTQAGGVIDIPLASDGVIRFSVAAGYSGVWIEGLGTGSGGGLTAKAKLKGFTQGTHVNTAIPVTGELVQPPLGAQIAIQRRLAKGTFKTIATSTATGSTYTINTPAVTQPGTYGFRTVLTQSGATLYTSNERTLTVNRAGIGLAALVPVPIKTPARLAGLQAGAPAGSVIRLRVKAPDNRFRTIREKPVSGAGFVMRYRSKVRGSYEVRVALRQGDKVWARSVPQVLRITK